MFVYTLKATTLKYIGVMAMCAVAIVLTVALVPTTDSPVYNDDVEAVAEYKSAQYKNVKSLTDRLDFLEFFGWEVDEASELEQDIVIPSEFNEVYTEYNELQKAQGLDLEKYKGKKAKQYTYTITNYSNGIVADARVIVYKDRIIGGDISSRELSGFMHGFDA